jgi:amidohydrolase
MVDLVTAVARAVVGESRTIEAQPIMASDDMAFFLQEVPGCYCFVGCSNPDKGFVHPAHTPLFDFDEEAMVVALELITRTALQYLGTP